MSTKQAVPACVHDAWLSLSSLAERTGMGHRDLLDNAVKREVRERFPSGAKPSVWWARASILVWCEDATRPEVLPAADIHNRRGQDVLCWAAAHRNAVREALRPWSNNGTTMTLCDAQEALSPPLP